MTIWDNLNANDYDQRRLCLGPFSGRSSILSSQLSGILMNPNCEFELNFIPLNTLGQWFQTLIVHQNDEQIDDNDVHNDDQHLDSHSNSTDLTNIYQIHQALERAILDWLPEFHKIKSPNEYQFITKVNSFFILFRIFLLN